MQRNIFIVNARIVDANGVLNTLSGYPKAFDSKNYDNDIDKARKRAEGEFSEVWGAFCKRDDRQLQTVILETADGFQLDRKSSGKIAEVQPPQPEPGPEPDPEINNEE